MVKRQEGNSYEGWLKIFGLFSLEKRRVKSDLIAVSNFLMRLSRDGGVDIFSGGGLTTDVQLATTMPLSLPILRSMVEKI